MGNTKLRCTADLLNRFRLLATFAGMTFAFSLSAQVPANKPSSQTQVPGASGTVLARPDEYTGSESEVNYIRSWEAMGRYTDINSFSTDAVSSTGYQHIKQVTQYFDGLGRPLQTVSRQASPGASPQDVVSSVVLDALGRETVRYLPYVQSNNNTNDGQFKSTPFTDQDFFYKTTYKDATNALMVPGEQALYSRTEYEASPLTRLTKTLAPGNSWAGSFGSATEKAATVQYLTNATADLVQIWNIANNALTYTNDDITTNIPVASSTPYAAGFLYKMVTIGEQGNAVVEYKDIENRTILKKVQAGAIASDYSGYDGFLSTYYIYDGMNRLRFVIPPKAVDAIRGNWQLTADVINELCFRYEYDGRNREIAKKVPGAGWVYLVYDTRDRLVFSQDANMRSNNQWATTLYDVLNRTIVTGITVYSGNPATLQTAVMTQTTTPGSPNTSIPVDIELSSDNTTGTSQALRSITLLPGFGTVTGGTYSANIVSGTSGSDGETTVIEGATVNKNPVPGGAVFTSLTETFYDNYSWYSRTFTSSYNGNLDAGTNQHAETMPSQQSAQTTNLITGTKTRILEDPSNLGSDGWLITASFYDDRGRVIQTQADNYRSGNDILTNRYNFTGSVLSSYLVHINPAAFTTKVKTNYEYDYSNRLLQIYKTINDDASTKVQIVRNSYDLLGNLLQKQLGQSKDASGNYTGSPLETLDYSYNIRGWLSGINRYYAERSTASETDRWFGMELDYDWGFDISAYSGNIAGAKWRSKGDGESRAYGFTYDAANRLMSADFSQYNGTAYADNSAINFDMMMGSNGTDVSSAYDPNGNIKKMQQWGMQLNQSPQIDNLTYSYYTNSNKLSGVAESGTGTTNYKLGDFTDNNTAGDDYGYDKEGNLITDKNKRINGSTGLDQTGGGAIVYNLLNLPWQITVKNDAGTATKGTITYSYDASGNKHKKETKEYGAQVTYNGTAYASDITTTTYYLDGFVYEAKSYSNASLSPLGYTDKLQFFSHEEGRVRPVLVNNQPTGFNYDYFIKDHLGNTRMVLTDEQEKDIYPAATLEGTFSDASTAVGYEKSFYTINTDNIVDKSLADGITDYQNNNGIANPYPSGNSGNANANNNSAKLYKLLAVGGEGVNGLGMTLKVMSGDKIDIMGKSYYPSANTGQLNYSIPVLDILTGLLSSPGGAATAKGFTASGLNADPNVTSPLNGFLGDPGRGTGTVPKAYINWILFDETFKQVNGGFSRVGSAGVIKDHYGDLSMQNIPVTKNGYIYIYVSNESPVAVFFDNLQVIHTRGPLLEETHYYPFGLRAEGICGNAASSLLNHYQYNGKELQNKEFTDGSGLELYDYGVRIYDPQIGRWETVDPLASKLPLWSPYVPMVDNPFLMFDADGTYPWPIWIRSFISTPTTGGGLFYGDGRGPSFGGTSRVWTKFTYDGTKRSISDNLTNIQSDYTVFYPGAVNPILPFVKRGDPKLEWGNGGDHVIKIGENTGSFDLHYWGKDPVTPSIFTPALDVHAGFSISEDMKARILSVSGTFTGDKFPSTESFIADQSGFKLFLGARKEDGGISDLVGDNQQPILNVDMRIKFDEKGNFIGVTTIEKGKDVFYKKDDWNKKVQAEWDKKDQ